MRRSSPAGDSERRPRGARRGLLLALLFVAILVTACDSAIAFYIRNDSPDGYFVRVMTDRGFIYVHQVEPNEAGYATRGVDPGPPGPDYTLELLDSGCNVLDTWQMPSDGGHLEIREDGLAEFTSGYYFDETPSGGSSSAGPVVSESPTDEQFPTVLECGATDVFTE